MSKYAILGTDLRSKNLRKLFKEDGYKLTDLNDSNIVIAPIPFSKDGINVTGEIIKCTDLIKSVKDGNKTIISGAFSKEMKEIMESQNINFVDVMQSDEMANKNAIPTAEGAIAIAILNTDFVLEGANTLVLGYGKIGKKLADKLYNMGANVYCEARKESDLEAIRKKGYNEIDLKDLNGYLSQMQVIFNTIPAMILDKERLDLIEDNTIIIDLASAPGGVDFKYAKEKNKNTEWALALPAKVAPLSSAKYYKEEIEKIVKKI